jgi:hypothetical protein
MDRPGSFRPKRPGGRAPISSMVEGLWLRDPSLPTPSLGRTAQDRIGRELRGMYAELERQPIPPRLLALVDKLSSPEDQDR